MAQGRTPRRGSKPAMPRLVPRIENIPQGQKFCPRCHRTTSEAAAEFCPYDGAALKSSRRIDEVRVRSGALRGWLIDGRYRIRGKIGSGGMAAVYLAEDERTGGPVAVKILDRQWTKDA